MGDLSKLNIKGGFVALLTGNDKLLWQLGGQFITCSVGYRTEQNHRPLEPSYSTDRD